MSRRNLLFGACLYLLALNQAPLAVLELVLPAIEEAVSSDFHCASHGCGCLSREGCRSRCCCLKTGGERPVRRHLGQPGHQGHRDHRPPGSRAGRVLAALVAGCSGGSDAAPNAKRIAPHLALSPLPAPRTGRRVELAALSEKIPVSAFREPPGRIPI
jgi:hypothetical protein